MPSLNSFINQPIKINIDAMVMKYFRSAWENYKKNFAELMVSYLVMLILGSVILALSIVPAIAAYFLSRNMAISFLLGLIFGVPALLFYLAITGSYIGVIGESIKRKPKVEVLFSTLKKKWKSIAGVIILLILILLAIFAIPIILIMFGAIQRNWIYIVVSMPLFIIGFLISILFALAPYAVVLDDKKPFNSIKISMNIVKKNYLEFLKVIILICLISFVFSFLFSLIPFGGMIFSFLVGPYILLVYALYYKKNKGR